MSDIQYWRRLLLRGALEMERPDSRCIRVIDEGDNTELIITFSGPGAAPKRAVEAASAAVDDDDDSDDVSSSPQVKRARYAEQEHRHTAASKRAHASTSVSATPAPKSRRRSSDAPRFSLRDDAVLKKTYACFEAYGLSREFDFDKFKEEFPELVEELKNPNAGKKGKNESTKLVPEANINRGLKRRFATYVSQRKPKAKSKASTDDDDDDGKADAERAESSSEDDEEEQEQEQEQAQEDEEEEEELEEVPEETPAHNGHGSEGVEPAPVSVQTEA